MITTKPCPFCGVQGQVKDIGGQFYVKCGNKKCRVQPMTQLRWNLLTVLHDWNEREEVKTDDKAD